jgi:hypothetical protein
LDDIKISRSGGSTTASNSYGSVTIHDRDIWDGPQSNSSRGGNSGGDRRSSNSSYSTNSSRSNSCFISERELKERSDREKREREARERTERIEKENARKEKERHLINEADKMLYNDCIDIQRMQLAIDEFDNLSPISADGHNARAKLMAQKHNMEPIYNKYSLMAMNIREFAFGGINTRMMSLSYEDLDKYLKQFLNKHDFERAKVEYQKHEKAKVLERDIEALHTHSNDKKYLRDNISNVQKLKSVIKQQDALKYVDSYYSFLLDEIEKTIEYDEIKQIPLTVSNIKTVLGPKKATKNNANWKEIAGGMTNQRLLSVLGTLNSDNNNILPDFVREEGGYYLFVGEPIETDTKIVTKEYLVSKDGSEIEIYETEGVVANNILEIKATLGDNKVSAKLTSDGEVEKKAGSTVAKNAAGAKVTLLNTDWHKQNKKNVFSIDTDGTILQYGGESSVGLKANISASANTDVNVPVGKTPIATADASVGAGIEAAHVGATLARKLTPKMLVNPDGSVSYRQYSASVEGGLSAGVSAKLSVSKDEVSAKVGAVSMGVSFASQDIDGALKQIDSDVVLGIIKTSIDNNNYESEFDDEAIGKTVVSSIRKEIEIIEKEVEKH